MNDNGDIIQPEKQEMQNERTLSIKLGDKGFSIEGQNIGNGTMFDEPICFWMLRKAEKFIEGHNIRAMKNNIVKPPAGMMSRVKGAFGK